LSQAGRGAVIAGARLAPSTAPDPAITPANPSNSVASEPFLGIEPKNDRFRFSRPRARPTNPWAEANGWVPEGRFDERQWRAELPDVEGRLTRGGQAMARRGREASSLPRRDPVSGGRRGGPRRPDDLGIRLHRASRADPSGPN